MAKAARNRREKQTSGKLLFPGFPYERAFTKAEQEVLFARMDRVAETLRDAVGPQGWGLGMSEDFLQQIALHQALAGVDADPTYPLFDPATGTGAFIRPIRNVDGLYVDSIKWQIIKHDKPGQRAADAKAEARARLKLLREQAMRTAPHEVREAMRELMVEGAEWAEQQLEPATDEEPAAKLAERSNQP